MLQYYSSMQTLSKWDLPHNYEHGTVFIVFFNLSNSVNLPLSNPSVVAVVVSSLWYNCCR